MLLKISSTFYVRKIMKRVASISVCLLTVASLMGSETVAVSQSAAQPASDAPLTYRAVDQSSLGIVIPNPLHRVGFIDRTPAGLLALGTARLTDHDAESYKRYKNNPERFQDEFQRSAAKDYYKAQDALGLSKKIEQEIEQLKLQQPPMYRPRKYYLWKSQLQEAQKNISRAREVYAKNKERFDGELKIAQDKFHDVQKTFNNPAIMTWENFSQQLPQQATFLKEKLQQCGQTKNYEQRLVLVSSVHVDAFNFMRSVNVAEQETWDTAPRVMDKLIQKFKNHKRSVSKDRQHRDIIMVRSDITDQELQSAMTSAEHDPEVQKLLQACGKLLLKNARHENEGQEAAKIKLAALMGAFSALMGGGHRH
jgi:hypothetical protein